METNRHDTSSRKVKGKSVRPGVVQEVFKSNVIT
jgi:hypothetical protein